MVAARRPSSAPSDSRVGASESVPALVRSLVGYALRAIRRAGGKKDCLTVQVALVLEWVLQLVGSQAATITTEEPMVPILVPASLANTVMSNIESWQTHRAAQAQVGKPVHFASMASVMACDLSGDTGRRKQELE